MGRLKIFYMVGLLALITIYGCSSDEEKKLSYLEKGKTYFEKGEYKSAEIELKKCYTD